ncbi:MAG TPA: redoxin domain-containing protein [Planctomycetaceae bacterium]|nr:redoxin domain-containing protein [Planctomycetaceae bacterium]
MSRAMLSVLLPLALTLGCGQSPPNVTPVAPGKPLSKAEADAAFAEQAQFISFLDDVSVQPAPQADLKTLSLTDTTGNQVALGEVAPGRHLVVVMTRGFNGGICPYCSTQTARLIANYSQIQNLNAEVVLIYPLEADKSQSLLQDFLGKVNAINKKSAEELPPFPVLLDVGLKVVDTLGLRKDLSKPATYILDPAGSVRFAYVGNTLNDRPSVKAIVQQLQQLQAADKSGG